MSDQPTERQKAIGGFADGIAQTLGSLPLLEADASLDEARRFAFTKVFSGFADLNVRESLKTADLPWHVAMQLAGLTLEETEQVIALVRRTLWSAHFATMPETKFWREFGAYMERVQHGSDADKLH
jgi:hypothetical protein